MTRFTEKANAITPNRELQPDEYFNETEQLFWNSQVERYISNQQLIAEKKRGSILVGNDTVFDILLLSDEMYLSNYMK